MHSLNQVTFLLLALSLFACTPNNPQTTEEMVPEVIEDNRELKEIYEADQGDRKAMNKDWKAISERDNQRQKRVNELLDSNQVNTSSDYFHAAMIFQHGADTIASGMAVKMMRKAMDLDTSRSKWLLAAAIDRDLMRRGKPQVYGTQYRRASQDGPWTLYQIDSTQVSDEERREYGVSTLAEQRERVRLMNKTKLAKLYRDGKNIAEIVDLARKEDLEDSEYNLSEGALNSFGYQLMREDKNEEALQIFKLNTELYPNAYNTFDSYGECLLKLGKKEEARKAYAKSLELDPENDNATKVLEEMDS
ncbi:tetratricopeptide repeat protein [bacterium SCSIO 12741]|nr:tetratricopeptide repeat protein [bacterium SCSIO 12741]